MMGSLVNTSVMNSIWAYTFFIQDQEMMHQKRESIIKELHNSEKMYIKNVLEVLRDSYILPLRKSAKQPSYGFLGMKKPPCTEREMNWLFCNFEDIIGVHQEILTSLEER